MEAVFVPLGEFGGDGSEEVDMELIVLLVALAWEGDGVLGEVDFVVKDIAEAEFDEDSVFPLGPLDCWVQHFSYKVSLYWFEIDLKVMFLEISIANIFYFLHLPPTTLFLISFWTFPIHT